jgi:hypothetical protein
MQRSYFRQDVQAVLVAHGDIENEHISAALAQHEERLATGRRFLDIRANKLLLEDSSQAGTKERVVVSQEDLDHAPRFRKEWSR